MRCACIALLCAATCGVHGQSLYREDSWRGLTADHKAYRTGDVLTVQVFENSSATYAPPAPPEGTN